MRKTNSKIKRKLRNKKNWKQLIQIDTEYLYQNL